MRVFLLFFLFLTLTGCARPAEEASPAPSVTASSLRETPTLDVYIVSSGTLLSMDIETYVAGVVAGEMPADFPREALRAQAILARTFVAKFVSEKSSVYDGADISTDIREAQAYNASAVTPAILEAVQSTRGLLLTSEDGSLPYTWFHAHSGGSTETARSGLDWQGLEPTYTRVTAGLDSPKASASAKAWSAAFPKADFIAACKKAGAVVASADSVSIKEKGDSGRAVTFLVDDVEVNAARLRIALGSTVMRSTLLTELTVTDGEIRMSGLGYGHGVGMPQWGAYALAESGATGEEIALHYYQGLKLIKAWGS